MFHNLKPSKLQYLTGQFPLASDLSDHHLNLSNYLNLYSTNSVCPLTPRGCSLHPHLITTLEVMCSDFHPETILHKLKPLSL
ncbi:unnamed protein product, partial [Iphiclides podalirius]